jgi:hypothetical protein
MLAHQLPGLPPLPELLGRLPDLIRWIDEPFMVPQPATLLPPPIRGGDSVGRVPEIRYWGGNAPLETIRFAGANRLIIEFDYHRKHRLVEPYSLRRPATGNLLFYGWDRGDLHIKAFKVQEMSNVRPTDQSFRPRYQVEFG